MEHNQDSNDLPIPLYAVLEEEYISLHGPLPESYYKTRGTTDQQRLAAICQQIHRLQDKPPSDNKAADEADAAQTQVRAAICLSGGGIRSGTFALGILQGLARHDLLKHIHYLSTVSGGGYIGGWLSAWIHREKEGQGLKEVTAALSQPQIDKKIDPEAEPIHYLREYSNFLTPKFSLLSADVWAFVAIIIRNLLLNWLVIIPLLAAALMLPRLCIAMVQIGSPPGWAVWSALVLGIVSGSIAIAYMGINRPSAGDSLRSKFWRDHNTQTYFLWLCLVPLSVSATLLTTYWAWPHERVSEAIIAAWPFRDFAFLARPLSGFILVAILMYFLGWLLTQFFLRFRWKELLMVIVLGVVGGALLWFAATKFFPQPITVNPVVDYGDKFVSEPRTELFVCFAAPLYLTVFLLAATLFVGFSSRQYRPIAMMDDEDREWLGRFAGWVLIAIIAWVTFSVDVVFGPLALWQAPAIIASLGGVSALTSILGGRSSKTPSAPGQTAKQGKASLLLDHALSIAAVLFIIILVAAISLLTILTIKLFMPDQNWSQSMPPEPLTKLHLLLLTHNTPVWVVVVLIVGLVAFGLGMAFAINLNKFSLHAAYRNRLIRAFLGASRKTDERKPNPFTGFDPSDNLQMHELRPGLLQLSSFPEGGLQSLVEKLYEAAEKYQQAGDDQKQSLRRSDAGCRIVSLFSDHASELLRNHKPGVPLTQSLKKALLEEMNRILEARDLYAVLPFADFPVDDRIKALVEFLSVKPLDISAKPHVKEFIESSITSPLSETVRGVYRIALNRYLIDMAFQAEINEARFPMPPFRMMHVVNMALNLVHGNNLAWQERRAESFIASPLYAGSLNPTLGYRRSRDYGGMDGISLGTSATISGAAANSNMGYYTSSAAMTFALTFFNARLGWWLGNPGEAGNNTYTYSCPQLAIRPLLAEAFGLTDNTSPYVLLSDGGHFENLGLYEMVLRRCKLIIVVDGSGDPDAKFNDLGNAIRKIRIDLGIPIEFKSVDIFPRSANKKGKYAAIGRIRYGCVDNVGDKRVSDGALIYIKQSFYGDEPRDVYNYAQAHPDFPHESTADQWFDESQFESHRMLGSHIMDQLAGDDFRPLSPFRFLVRASRHCYVKQATGADQKPDRNTDKKPDSY